ncbi:MAG: VOC family protein [Chloroflexi bacterium]|nr:VOC family protein [Chloroflexota bacterium]
MAITQEVEGRKAGRPTFALEAVSAITLATHDMARSVRFYRALGFPIHYGGEDADFTSFRAGELTHGSSYLNIILVPRERELGWWGRVIFHVSDVDAAYQCAIAGGLSPQFPPADAPWGERYFHLTDPDGHELSFARPLERPPV